MSPARDGDQEQSGCTLRKLSPRRVILQTALEYIRENGTQPFAHCRRGVDHGGGRDHITPSNEVGGK